jgi:hypothetical protein
MKIELIYVPIDDARLTALAQASGFTVGAIGISFPRVLAQAE